MNKNKTLIGSIFRVFLVHVAQGADIKQETGSKLTDWDYFPYLKGGLELRSGVGRITDGGGE